MVQLQWNSVPPDTLDSLKEVFSTLIVQHANLALFVLEIKTPLSAPKVSIVH